MNQTHSKHHHQLLLFLAAGLIGITCLIYGFKQKDSAGVIQLEEIAINNKQYIVTIIDPKSFQFSIAENSLNKSLSIKEALKTNNSSLAFNGSFFDTSLNALGLVISGGKTLAEFQSSKLMNGVFIITHDNAPIIMSDKIFQEKQKDLSSQIDFAIQSGPVLLDNNKIEITNANDKSSSRTAIGVTSTNQVVVIMLRANLFNQENRQTLYEFAKTIQTAPAMKKFQIKNLINLDGGKSSGLATPNTYLPEFEKVQNIILVKPNSND